MARALPLDEMKPGAPANAVARTVLAVGEISDAEITQWLREAFDKPRVPRPGSFGDAPGAGVRLIRKCSSLESSFLFTLLVNPLSCASSA